MTNLNQKIAAITALFEGDAALLEGALKEDLILSKNIPTKLR